MSQLPLVSVSNGSVDIGVAGLQLKPSATKILQSAVQRGNISIGELTSFLPNEIVKDRGKLSQTLQHLGKLLKGLNVSLTTEKWVPEESAKTLIKVPKIQPVRRAPSFDMVESSQVVPTTPIKVEVEKTEKVEGVDSVPAEEITFRDTGEIVAIPTELMERFKKPLFKTEFELESAIVRSEERNSNYGKTQVMWQYMREIKRYPLLKHEQIIELFRQMVEEKSDDARQAIILHNLRLVLWLAPQFSNRGLAYEDVVQEGNIGLMKAVDRFDYKRGFHLSTYAQWWIRQSLSRAVQDQASIVRVPVHIQETFFKHIKRYPKGTEESAIAAHPELAESLAHFQEMNRIGQLLRDTQNFIVSLNSDSEDKNGSTITELGKKLADNRSKPVDQILDARGDFREVEADIQTVINTIDQFPTWPERNKKMFLKYYGLDGSDGCAMEEIAGEHGISRARVHQIITKTHELLEQSNVNIDQDTLMDLVKSREILTNFISTDTAD